MSLTLITSHESARRNFFMNTTYIMSRKKESNVLCSGDRNVSNTHLFARIGEKKFFHEFVVHDVYKVGMKRFWAQQAEMSLTPISWLESARRYFSWTRRTCCLENRKETFLDWGSRNKSNTHQFARIGEKKISHEFDVQNVCKVGIKRFWAQEAKMNLTPNSLLESARKKFFMNSTYIMSRK